MEESFQLTSSRRLQQHSCVAEKVVVTVCQRGKVRMTEVPKEIVYVDSDEQESSFFLVMMMRRKR